MREVEKKFIEIDPEDMHRRLLAAGATLVFDTTMASAYGTDPSRNILPGNVHKQELRVRTIGEHTTLTLKGTTSSETAANREEIELEIADREKMIAILEHLGISMQKKDSKRRRHFTRGACAFEIDQYTHIPAFLEIEAPTEEELNAVCVELGLDPAQGIGKTIAEIYNLK